MSSASIYIFVTAMLWGKTSRPAPRVSTLVPFITNYNVEYRDGIKSEGDKIGMPCTHSTVM